MDKLGRLLFLVHWHYEEFEERYEPIDELPSSEYLRLDTSRPVDENASQLESTFGG